MYSFIPTHSESMHKINTVSECSTLPENMAGVSAPPAAVLLSKRVQEMVLRGEDPPAPYRCRDDGGDDAVDSSLSLIPAVDLSLVSSLNSSPEGQEELQKLKSALSSWGCFQATGHGISSSFLDKIRKVTREFFEQPMEAKMKHCKNVEEFEGYGGDPVPEDGQSLDWSDRLFLDVHPEDRRKPKFWPQNPKSFRDDLEHYTEKMKEITDLISKAMARSLNLEESCFLNQFGERRLLQARFNYYSCCERPDLVLGLKAHADGSGFTVILQDNQVEGLQLLKNGNWFTVPTIPHALLVLMGDQMEIMSNGIFKSPVHRVVTNSEKERISVAMFYTPDPEKEIGPEGGLANTKAPILFKKVKNYGDIHWGYYQKGMRALHVAKV